MQNVASFVKGGNLLLRWNYLPLPPSSHAWLSELMICIYNFHTFCIFTPSGLLKIFQTELFWSPVQSKIQIIRGLTGRPIPTDPAPSFPELPLRIFTVYSALCLSKRGSGYVLFRNV